MTGRPVARLALAAALAVAAGAPASAAAPGAPAPGPDAGAAKAAAPAPAAARPTDPAAAKDAARARALLATLEQDPDAGKRLAAAADLAKLGPHIEAQLAAFLARPHASTPDDRRALLKQIKASVPDEKGRFHHPGRMSDADVAADDKLDWLAELVELDPATPGLGETIADVAAIRALAATRDLDAATAVLDAAFADDTMVYRDECGRRLREMAPYSIPALTIAAEARRGFSKKRYANYQLERLDRQEPEKALAAAVGDENLRVAILDAFRKTHHREAVHAVLATVNDESPRVRAAARAAWMAYVSGKAPRPAPKKKLTLPGGKVAVKETPLWMTYRELADADLRKLASDLLGEDYPEKKRIDLVKVSKEVFAHYDDERRQRDDAAYAAAKTRADAGDLAAATAVFDRLLAADPDRPQRVAMAGYYLAYGKQLEAGQKWREAATAYAKAAGLSDAGATATTAQAAHDHALGKALEAAGKDGRAALRRAAALDPHYAAPRTASEDAGGGGAPSWMLYVAAVVGAVALALLVLGLRRRAA
jgi:hypothetical protein